MEQSIPSVYYSVESFGTTANGKVDRNNVQLDRVLLEYSTECREVTAVESKLMSVWEKILGFSNICPDTPFYFQEGTLHVPRMVELINKSFNSQITAGQFLQYSSIAEMASLLEGNVAPLTFSKKLC